MSLAAATSDRSTALAAMLAMSYAGLGRPGLEDRLRTVEAAARASIGRASVDEVAAACTHYFVAAAEADQVGAAAWCVEQLREVASTTRRPLHRWRASVLASSSAMLQGDLGAAREAADDAADTARQYRLVDGAGTALLQRAVIEAAAGEPPNRLLSAVLAHPLSHALDAVRLSSVDTAESARHLAAAVRMLPTLPPDYLRWSSIAMTLCASIALGDEVARATVVRARGDCDVARGVVGMGTAIAPLAPSLWSVR